MTMSRKYFKPKSLTWWAAGVSPVFAGLFVATEPLHGMYGISQSIVNATGMSAPVLINVGIAGIGLRGAFKDD